MQSRRIQAILTSKNNPLHEQEQHCRPIRALYSRPIRTLYSRPIQALSAWDLLAPTLKAP